MGFTCGYPWEVSFLSFGLLVRRASWDLPHEFFGEGLFLVAGMDAAIVERVQLCHVCAALGKYAPRAPISTLRNGLLSKVSVCALISLRRAS